MYLCTRDEIDEYFTKAKNVLHGITSPFLGDRVASLSMVHQNFSTVAMKNFDASIVNDYNKIVKGFSYELLSVAPLR
jgi:hypothetical protein